MFKRGYIFVLILLIFAIISLSAVSASDLNATDEVIADEISMDSELGQTDDVILGAGGNTFTDLNNKISSSGSTVTLDRDYYYTDSDEDFEEGIEIDKTLTINGNGHTIYANGARAFYIGENANVTINELNFVNDNETFEFWCGGTIWNDGILTLESCEFINSTAIYYGGAIFSSNELIIDSCNFTNNWAWDVYEGNESSGGAIYSFGLLGVYYSIFIQNGVEYGGGAIYGGTSEGGYCEIIASTFAYNYAGWGGAIYSCDYVADCGFIYNGADDCGGAMVDCYAVYSDFIENTATNGGAVAYSSVDSCYFEDNVAYEEGDDTYVTEVLKPILSVANFTSTYNSGDKLIVNFTTSEGVPINGDDVTIDVYKDGSLVGTYYCLSGDGWIVSLNPGSYIASVSVEPGYLIDPVEARLTINDDTKTKTKITLQNNDGTLVAKLTNAATGKAITNANVVFTINNVNHSAKTDSNGLAKYTIPSLDSGTYPVTATYRGNSKYEPSSANISITVKADTILSLNFNNGAREVVATLTNGATGQVIKNANVRFVVNGVKSSAKTDANGQAKVSVSSLAMGTYDASASYDGNSKYNPSSDAISFTINKVMTTVTQYYDASTKELVATLINAETGAPIKGATLVFNFNGVKTPVKTDVNGQARFSIGKVNPNGLSAGISYGGNSKYLRSSGSIKIVTDKVPTTISNFYNKETQEVVVTLINLETGKPIKGATVVFNFNGVKTPLKTDANGQVKMSVSKLTSKEYTIGSSYGGNSKYAGSTASLNFFKI